MHHIYVKLLPESARELDQRVVGMPWNEDTSDRQLSMSALDDHEAPRVWTLNQQTVTWNLVAIISQTTFHTNDMD